MSRIIHAAQASFATVPPLNHVPHTKRGVLACAARDIGERLEAKALVAFIQSGDTARRLARLHTRLPLLAFIPEPGVRNQLALSWGIETFLVPQGANHRRHGGPGRLGRSFVILTGLIKVLTSDNESTTIRAFCLHARWRLGSRASR